MSQKRQPNLRSKAKQVAELFFQDVRGLDLLPYCSSTTEAYDIAELLENARIEVHWKG